MRKIRFKKGYEEISGTFWWNFVNSAKKRNLKVSVDIKFLWNLYLKQNKKCQLSGVNLKIDVFGRNKEKLDNDCYFASLDRIDNNIGYVEGNVRWIAREINYMKWKFSDDVFIHFCKNISESYA